MAPLYLPHSTVDYNHRIQSVWIKWTAHIYGNDFRETLEEGLKLLIYNKGHRWIEDQNVAVTIDGNDSHWYKNVWLQDAINKGLKFMAIVIPKSAISRLRAQKLYLLSKEGTDVDLAQEITLTKNIDGKLLIQYFDSTQSAEEWIQNCH